MKILVVHETLNLGGAETMAIELANGLASVDGLEVSFAAAEGPLQKRVLPEVRYYPIPPYSLFKIPAIISTLKKIILEVEPELIHSQGATIGMLVGVAARSANKNIKLLLTHHSKGFTRLPKFMSIALFKKYTDFIITISQDKYQSLTRGGISSERVQLIPNFVDVDLLQNYARKISREAVLKELGMDAKSKIVTMTGRLIPEKRFDRFVQILAQCAKETDQLIVGLAIGDGPDRSKLEKQASVAGKGNLQILFLGFQSDVFKYLSVSDIFLFPTEHPEVLPMCLIEALALGVPAVCSNILGNNDIVAHEETGFWTDGRTEDYCDKVLKILKNQEFANKLSTNCVSRARKLFDKKVVVEEILKVYRRILM